jgi:putative ABC transport system permease protein
METISVAFGAIVANPLRSFLTMLGIVIGVGAVITMVALGTGAQVAVEEQLEALGTDLLTVYPGQARGHGGVASSSRNSLRSTDAVALEQDAGLRAVVPEMSRNQQVEYGGQNINVSVVATTPNYIPVNNYEVVAGRTFTAGDDFARHRVTLIGNAVPGMFGVNGRAMIGQQVLIRGIPFEIIGVLGEKGAQGYSNPDEQLLIPLGTGQFRVFGTDVLRSITVKVESAEDMTLAMIDIEQILRREHGIQPGGDNDFNMRNRTEFLSAAQNTTQTFTALLAGIAAVSLLVGGIGIMNIMLVSVTERTREIGIRKALGARRKAIMFQFLVEALSLCMLGGVGGILFGVAAATFMTNTQGWSTQVSTSAVMLAVLFSAAIGLFFGIWPAFRASSLDPIEALRHE